MDSESNPWIIENRSRVALRAYRAASSAGTTTADELDKIMEVSLKNSPSKSENKEIRNLIGSVRERMDTLQVQYEDTRSVMAEMKGLLLEQQEHIRKLQTKEAERQIVDSDVNENRRNEISDKIETHENNKMKIAQGEKNVNTIDDDSYSRLPKDNGPKEKDNKNTIMQQTIATEESNNTGSQHRPNVVGETQFRDLSRDVEKYKLEYQKASNMYDQERKTSLYWKRRAESNADTIGHLEKIIQQQKRMINAMNNSSRKINRGNARSHRHKKYVSSSRRKKSSASSSSRSLRSLEGSLELNLSWPPLSSSEEEEEEEEELIEKDVLVDEEKNGEGGLNGVKGTYKPEDPNDDNVGDEKPLSKSQEESFAIIQDFYDKKD